MEQFKHWAYFERQWVADHNGLFCCFHVLLCYCQVAQWDKVALMGLEHVVLGKNNDVQTLLHVLRARGGPTKPIAVLVLAWPAQAVQPDNRGTNVSYQ